MNRPTAILLLTGVLLLGSMAGCAHKPKSSTRVYEGDSPTITYTNRESAGGPIGGR